MDDAGIAPARHRLTVRDYHRMADAGIFGEDDRIELIDGDLIDMAPIGPGHASVVNRLTQAFVLACAGRAIASIQNPVALDDTSEPQPDVVISRLRDDFYATGHPGPADILLLVEVADSSLRFDRTVKLPLYARAGIAEVWIVDSKHRTIDANKKPVGSGYGEMVTHQTGEQFAFALGSEIARVLNFMLD